MNDLRRIIKIEATGAERQVRMSDLLVGDKYRIETDGPTDHLRNKQHIVYTVVSPAREVNGVWEIEVDSEVADALSA